MYIVKENNSNLFHVTCYLIIHYFLFQYCLFVLTQVNGEFVAGYSEDKINKVFRKAPADKITLAIRERLVISSIIALETC